MEGPAIFKKIVHQISRCCTRHIISPTHVKVHISGGVPYESFDSFGCIPPWNILRVVELARVMSFNPVQGDDRTIIDATKLDDVGLLFNASTYTSIEPEFYDLSVLKGPEELDVKVTHIGNSSFKITVSVYFPDFEKPLTVNDSAIVLVSKQSRKPIPFPDWWRQKFEGVGAGDVPLKLHLSTVSSSELWERELTVPPSDTNAIGHASWASYVKYSEDAFLLQKLESGNRRALELARKVKAFSVVYKSECITGDRLKVKCWQVAENGNKNVFRLLRSSELAAEYVVECYPEEGSVASKL